MVKCCNERWASALDIPVVGASVLVEAVQSQCAIRFISNLLRHAARRSVTLPQTGRARHECIDVGALAAGPV